MTQWQKVALYAIVPALIAGLFSIAPKLYDILLEPGAELTYQLTSGPELQTSEGIRQILSITVFNSGKKPTTDVKATLELPQGRIEQYKLTDYSGVAPTVQTTESNIAVTSSVLLPQEKFAITAMTLAPISIAAPHFTLRSKEVVGRPAEIASSRRDDKLPFIGAVLAAISVFLMSTYFMFWANRRGLRLGNEKQDILLYIASRVGLGSISDVILRAPDGLTYLKMADLLLAFGLERSDERRRGAIAGLKALLLVKNMAGTSRDAIVDNLKTLEGEQYAPEVLALLNAKAVPVTEVMDLRGRINSLVSNETAFLTS